MKTRLFISLITLASVISAHAAADESTGPPAVLDLARMPTPGESLVWSPLFQACWDKLGAMHAGRMEKVEPANALIDLLNQTQWKKDDVMPKDGYGLYAGPSTKEFADATAAEIEKKFGVKSTPPEISTTPGAIAVHGILVRDLIFKSPFYRSNNKPLDFKDSTGTIHKVAFFGTAGIYSDSYIRQVKVIDYKEDGKSFILTLATDKEDESIIIYRPEQAMSFEKAITQVETASKSPFAGSYGELTDKGLHKNDTLKIPCLTLDSNTKFTSQLKGAMYYAGDSVPWEIMMAYQTTRFELSEKGVKIRVESGAACDPFGSPPPPPPCVPRNFICDGPFFVFAWRKQAAWPYFAAWIDSKAALTPFSPGPDTREKANHR